MKKAVIVALACLMTTSAFAGNYPYYHRHYYHYDNGAALGLGIIGGIIIGGAIANSHRHYETDRCWYERRYDYYGRPYRELVCSNYYDHEDYE